MNASASEGELHASRERPIVGKVALHVKADCVCRVESTDPIFCLHANGERLADAEIDSYTRCVCEVRFVGAEKAVLNVIGHRTDTALKKRREAHAIARQSAKLETGVVQPRLCATNVDTAYNRQPYPQVAGGVRHVADEREPRCDRHGRLGAEHRCIGSGETGANRAVVPIARDEIANVWRDGRANARVLRSGGMDDSEREDNGGAESDRGTNKVAHGELRLKYGNQRCMRRADIAIGEVTITTRCDVVC